MKKHLFSILSIFSIAALFFVFTSCGGGGSKPEVDPSKVYTEQNEEGNGSFSDAEETNFTLDGQNWYELTGTYVTSDDKDYFKVSVDPAVFGSDTSYKIQLKPCSEGELIGKLKSLGFPAGATTYNKEGKVITNYLLIAASSGFDITPETDYFVIHTSGREVEDGEGSYEAGKTYSMILK